MGKFEVSLQEGQHSALAQLAGEWQGTVRTWFEPEKLADESPIEGTVRLVLDGRFAMHEYHSTMQGKPYSGITIWGYNLQKERWQSVLIDSFHMSTGVMFSEGTSGKAINVLGSYGGDKPGEEIWGWRSEIKQSHQDELIFTSYNITPTGDEAKAVEVVYQRRIASWLI
jgi:hypothetical protein